MHDSDSRIGIDSGIIPLLAGIGIGIRNFKKDWNQASRVSLESESDIGIKTLPESCITAFHLTKIVLKQCKPAWSRVIAWHGRVFKKLTISEWLWLIEVDHTWSWLIMIDHSWSFFLLVNVDQLSMWILMIAWSTLIRFISHDQAWVIFFTQLEEFRVNFGTIVGNFDLVYNFKELAFKSQGKPSCGTSDSIL